MIIMTKHVCLMEKKTFLKSKLMEILTYWGT